MSFSTSKNSANALISAVNNKNRKKVTPSVFSNRNQSANVAADGFSDISSNLSSNNLTCSDLDTTNSICSSNGGVGGGKGVYDLKAQRKKLIKCILREDLDVIVSLASFFF
jgi:hypothetical protein